MKPETALRLLRVGLHLTVGAVKVLIVFPLVSAGRRRRMKARWSRRLLEHLGIELRHRGGWPGGLLVANHISFLDIYVLNAITPVAFVAKVEVRNWPLLGWLAKRNDTLFLERGSRAAAQRARNELTGLLQSGGCAGVFPEGTSTLGKNVLPFHAALFQAAIDAGVTVTPVALRYRQADGQRSEAPAYIGDITLWQCLVAVASCDRLIAEVEVLAPLPSSGTGRKQLAARAHHAIVRCIGGASELRAGDAALTP